jgi:hypothetical protein
MFEYFFAKAVKGMSLVLLMVVRFHILTPFRVVTPLFPFTTITVRIAKLPNF